MRFRKVQSHVFSNASFLSAINSEFFLRSLAVLLPLFLPVITGFLKNPERDTFGTCCELICMKFLLRFDFLRKKKIAYAADIALNLTSLLDASHSRVILMDTSILLLLSNLIQFGKLKTISCAIDTFVPRAHMLRLNITNFFKSRQVNPNGMSRMTSSWNPLTCLPF